MKQTQKQNKKKHSKKKYSYKRSHSNKIIDFDTEYKLALDIVNDITIEKTTNNKKLDYYWIISKKYNEYLDSSKYRLVHFLIYCLLRFRETPYQPLITQYVNYPLKFSNRINYILTMKYMKYNCFNYLLFLNNFMYYLLETNQYLDTFCEESKPSRWGYNIAKTTINKKPYYNIYFVVKHHEDLSKSNILISNNYPQHFINIYFIKLRYFYKSNQHRFIDYNLLTNVCKFTLTHKYDYQNKYLLINDLYIPKCHIELYDNQPIDVYMYLLLKEINYPTLDRLRILANIAMKYRNIEQLKEHLKTANVSITDFNEMIRSVKPLGFTSKTQYRNFITDIANIVKTKFNNFTIKVIGSGTTFYSASPKHIKADKFYSNLESDIDINIISNDKLDKYIPELSLLADGKYNTAIGVYVNPLTRTFFGEELMGKFFKKWGPQELGNFPKIYEPVDIDKTILKKPVSITICTKRDLYEYFNIIQENKTCLSNFSTFIRDGKTISYWDDEKYITEILT